MNVDQSRSATVRPVQQPAEAQEDAEQATRSDDPDQIRQQIEQTRADMSDTIEAIQDRLNPGRVAEQVKGEVRAATIGRAEHMVNEVSSSVRGASNGFLDTIRDNPVPAALAAIGLGWLWLKRPSAERDWRVIPGEQGDVRYVRGNGGSGPDRYSTRVYGSRVRDDGTEDQGGPGAAVGGAARQAGQTVQQTASQAGDTLQQVAGQASGAVQSTVSQVQGSAQQLGTQAQQTAQQFGAQAQQTAQRARSSLQTAHYENPLGMGAIALLAGLAVGLAAPSTDVEDQFMGDTRDRVLQQGQDRLQGTLEQVGHVAQRAAEAATRTAQDAAQQEGLTPS
jgi:gas vesicle protein